MGDEGFWCPAMPPATPQPKSRGGSEPTEHWQDHWQQWQESEAVSKATAKAKGRGFTSLIVLIFVAAFAIGDNGLLMQFTRVATSFACVSASAGRSASVLIDRASDATVSTSSAMLAVTTSTASIVDTAWRGIDLYNLHGELHVGKVIFGNSQVFEDWAHSDSGRIALGTADPEALRFWEAAARSASLIIPAQDMATAKLASSAFYWAASCRVFLLPSGYVAFEFRFATVSFEAHWANPVWEVLNLSTDGQGEQVTALVEIFVRGIPSKNVSWEVVLHDASQASISSLWAWAASGAWKNTFMRHFATAKPWCASYWGHGLLCFSALTILHLSSRARQLLRDFCTRLSSMGWAAAWPARKIMERMAWMWDWNFEIIPSS